MNSTLLTQRTRLSAWEPKLPFDLLVAYENRETRNRALHLYDHLAQQLLNDYDFQCSWWKLDHLANPALRQEAADAAVDANMVILSLGCKSRFTTEQREWIADWTERRPHRKSAFVVLIAGTNTPERDAAPLLDSLSSFARRAGMDFFPHGFSIHPEVSQPVIPAPSETPAHRASATTPLMQDLLQQTKHPYPRWGINE